MTDSADVLDGPDEPLAPHLGFGPPVTFYLPTEVGKRLEERCRREFVLDAAGKPDLIELAELATIEEGGGAFTIAAARRLIDGPDTDLATLVREIVRSQLLLAGHIAAAGQL